MKEKKSNIKENKNIPPKKPPTLSSLEEQPFQDLLVSPSINFRASQPTETAPQESKNKLTTTHRNLHII